MGVLTLGFKPVPIEVPLTIDADYLLTLRLDTNWPAGTTVSMVLGGTAYNATILGTDAVFTIDKAVTNTIPHGADARIRYVNGTTDQTWGVGRVVRHD